MDDSNYIVSDRSNGDVYRVYHSDVAKTALVTVQLLDKPGPRYAYWSWRLSEMAEAGGPDPQQLREVLLHEPEKR